MATQHTTEEVLLDIKGISLSFGGVKALSNISFDVRKGEIRAIIGPNGAGKSSMLNCINGFYHHKKAKLRLKAKPANRCRPIKLRNRALPEHSKTLLYLAVCRRSITS